MGLDDARMKQESNGAHTASPLPIAETDYSLGPLSSVLASIGELVCVFDRQKHVLYANRALAKLWGIDKDGYEGKTTAELGYPSTLHELLDRHLEQVFTTGGSASDEVFYINPQGLSGYYSYIFYPVFSDDGVVTSVVCVSHNVTER